MSFNIFDWDGDGKEDVWDWIEHDIFMRDMEELERSRAAEAQSERIRKRIEEQEKQEKQEKLRFVREAAAREKAAEKRRRFYIQNGCDAENTVRDMQVIGKWSPDCTAPVATAENSRIRLELISADVNMFFPCTCNREIEYKADCAYKESTDYSNTVNRYADKIVNTVLRISAENLTDAGMRIETDDFTLVDSYGNEYHFPMKWPCTYWHTTDRRILDPDRDDYVTPLLSKSKKILMLCFPELPDGAGISLIIFRSGNQELALKVSDFEVANSRYDEDYMKWLEQENKEKWKLEEELVFKNADIDRLKDKLSYEEKEAKELQRQLNKAKNSLDETKSELEEARDRAERLAKHSERMEKELESLELDMKELKEKYAALERAPRETGRQADPRAIYRYCKVKVDGFEREYSYIDTEQKVNEGDRVKVPFGADNIEKEGTVTEVKNYRGSEVPYPAERTKGIGGVVSGDF